MSKGAGQGYHGGGHGVKGCPLACLLDPPPPHHYKCGRGESHSNPILGDYLPNTLLCRIRGTRRPNRKYLEPTAKESISVSLVSLTLTSLADVMGYTVFVNHFELRSLRH